LRGVADPRTAAERETLLALLAFKSTVTTAGVKLKKENDPALFELGFGIINEISANDLFGITKFDNVGVAIFTVKILVIDAEENPSDAVCVAVIFAFPAFRIVTVSPLIDIICDPAVSVVNV
jgi:hypothetical protein